MKYLHLYIAFAFAFFLSLSHHASAQDAEKEEASTEDSASVDAGASGDAASAEGGGEGGAAPAPGGESAAAAPPAGRGVRRRLELPLSDEWRNGRGVGWGRRAGGAPQRVQPHLSARESQRGVAPMGDIHHRA